MAENTIDNLSIQITANAEQAAKVFDRLASNAGKLKGAASGAADGLDELSQSAQDVANTAGEASDQTGELVPKMRETSSAAKAAGGAAKIAAVGIKAFWSALKWVGSAIKTISIKGFQLGMRGIRAAANGARAALSGLRNAIVGVGKGFVSFIGGRISGFGQRIKGITGAVTGLLKSIGRVAFYRAIRSAIKLVTKAFSEGISNLYQWSLLVDKTFANSMDKLATSAQYLKNSLGAMVSPLINAFAPAIDAIVDKLVDAINLVNQFFAAITGSKTYTAAKKIATEWAENETEKANKNLKDLKKTILGFDELNILNKDNRTDAQKNGKNVADYKNMFENRKVESGIADFAKRIRAAFNSGDWAAIGSLAADKLTGWINKIDWANLGLKLGNGLNKIVSVYNGFMDKFDFENFGTKFATSVNSLISTVNWEELGRTLTQKLNAISGALYGFATTFEWGEAGTKFGEAINGLLTNINWTTLTNAFTSLIKGAVSGMINFVSTFEWGEHGKNFHFAVLKLIKEFPAQEIGTFLTISIRGIFDSLGQTVTDPLVWSGLGTKLADFLNTVFSDKEMWNKVGTTANGFMKGILTFGEDFLKDFNATTAGTNIGNALREIDWVGIATRTWGFIKTAFSKTGSFIDALLSEDVSKATSHDQAIEMMMFNDQSFGTKLGKRISKAIAGINWKQFGSDIGNGTIKLFETIADFFKAIRDDGTLSSAIVDFFSGLPADLPERIVGAASETFYAIGQEIAKAVWGGIKLMFTPDSIRREMQGIKGNAVGVWKGAGVTGDLPGDRNTPTVGAAVTVPVKPIVIDKDQFKREMELLTNPWVDMDVKVDLVRDMWSTVHDWAVQYYGENVDVYTQLGKFGWSFVDRWVEQYTGSNIWQMIGLAKDGWSTVTSWTSQYTTGDVDQQVKLSVKNPTGFASSIQRTLHSWFPSLFAKGGVIQHGRIQRFAGGGSSNNHGSLFLAGEAGPEIVGHVGGRTEVLNKSQLASAMYSAVRSAMSGVSLNATFDYGNEQGGGNANIDQLVELVRAEKEATQRQNELLRQQNEYLRQLNEKEFTSEITTSQYTRAQKRSNMRAGVAVVPIG